MSRPQSLSFVGIALARLRWSVLVCCWTIALALIVQIGVWITATFTDVRFETIKDNPSPAMIVASTIRPLNEPVAIETGAAAAKAEAVKDMKAVDPNRVPSKVNRMMSFASRLASGAGMLGLFTLLPLLAVGVLLTAGSATPGVEHTVSAFTWSIVLGLLILPIAGFVGLPWREGALHVYSSLTQHIDAAQAAGQDAGGMTYYARFAFLPLACIIGTAMIGLRFCAGVESAMPKKEDMRLDPLLEREAANITPTSLHGARTGMAFKAPPPPAPPSSTAAQPHPAGMTQPTAGVAPKRLI